MAIATSLQDYLQRHDIPYDIIEHAPAMTMRAAAHETGISEDSVVKAVLLEDEDGYVLVAVPASCHVQLGRVARLLKHPVGLASETEVAELFGDCARGALPPVGDAYGLDMVVDEQLDAQLDLYFEGGDHRSLVHVKGEDFARLQHEARYGHVGARNGSSGPGRGRAA